MKSQYCSQTKVKTLIPFYAGESISSQQYVIERHGAMVRIIMCKFNTLGFSELTCSYFDPYGRF
jgi:hypothetical protein